LLNQILKENLSISGIVFFVKRLAPGSECVLVLQSLHPVKKVLGVPLGIKCSI